MVTCTGAYACAAASSGKNARSAAAATAARITPFIFNLFIIFYFVIPDLIGNLLPISR